MFLCWPLCLQLVAHFLSLTENLRSSEMKGKQPHSLVQRTAWRSQEDGSKRMSCSPGGHFCPRNAPMKHSETELPTDAPASAHRLCTAFPMETAVSGFGSGQLITCCRLLVSPSPSMAAHPSPIHIQSLPFILFPVPTISPEVFAGL